jgi:pimeloyl-ACP methyl ester carboxylesterase
MSLSRAAEAVTALIDELELDRFTLVVHDVGGPVGLAIAATMPERVEGIVAISRTPAVPPTSTTERRARLRAVLPTGLC